MPPTHSRSWFNAIEECYEKSRNFELKEEIAKGLSPQIANVNWVVDNETERWVIENISARWEYSYGAVRKALADVVHNYTVFIDYVNSDEDLRKNKAHAQKLKFKTMANFLRNLAWLHPFQHCNNRLITLLLQKEIRRHGLGCGAILFDNDINMYFSTTRDYEDFITEGINRAIQMFETGVNPWLNGTLVREHEEAFHRGPWGQCASELKYWKRHKAD